MRAQVQAGCLPCRKVVGDRDSAAIGPLVDTVRNVLPESRRAHDGGLVDLLMLPDLVRAPVAGEGAELLTLRRSLAVRRVFLNVVLDQRVLGPAVKRDKDGSRASSCAAGESNVPEMKDKDIRTLLGIERPNSSRIRIRSEKVNESRATNLVVPVLQPFPTTKSPAPEKLTE